MIHQFNEQRLNPLIKFIMTGVKHRHHVFLVAANYPDFKYSDRMISWFFSTAIASEGIFNAFSGRR